jgi:chromosome segregation ATPase
MLNKKSKDNRKTPFPLPPKPQSGSSGGRDNIEGQGQTSELPSFDEKGLLDTNEKMLQIGWSSTSITIEQATQLLSSIWETIKGTVLVLYLGYVYDVNPSQFELSHTLGSLQLKYGMETLITDYRHLIQSVGALDQQMSISWQINDFELVTKRLKYHLDAYSVLYTFYQKIANRLLGEGYYNLDKFGENRDNMYIAIDGLFDQIEELGEEHENEIEAEKTKLNEAHEEKLAELQKIYQNAIDQWEQANTQLFRDKQNLENEVIYYRTEQEKTEKEKNTLQSRFDSLENDNTDLNNQLIEANGIIQKYEGSYTKLFNEKASMEQELAEKDAHISELEITSQENKQKWDETEDELDRVIDQLNVAQNEVDTKTEELDKTKELLDRETQINSNLQWQIGRLEKGNKELLEKIDEMESSVTRKDEEIAELQQRIRILEEAPKDGDYGSPKTGQTLTMKDDQMYAYETVELVQGSEEHVVVQQKRDFVKVIKKLQVEYNKLFQKSQSYAKEKEEQLKNMEAVKNDLKNHQHSKEQLETEKKRLEETNKSTQSKNANLEKAIKDLRSGAKIEDAHLSDINELNTFRNDVIAIAYNLMATNVTSTPIKSVKPLKTYNINKAYQDSEIIQNLKQHSKTYTTVKKMRLQRLSMTSIPVFQTTMEEVEKVIDQQAFAFINKDETLALIKKALDSKQTVNIGGGSGTKVYVPQNNLPFGNFTQLLTSDSLHDRSFIKKMNSLSRKSPKYNITLKFYTYFTLITTIKVRKVKVPEQIGKCVIDFSDLPKGSFELNSPSVAPLKHIHTNGEVEVKFKLLSDGSVNSFRIPYQLQQSMTDADYDNASMTAISDTKGPLVELYYTHKTRMVHLDLMLLREPL